MSGSVRVLLLWPGTDGPAAGNFGVPQLVLLATYAREKTGARVDIRDLVAEQALTAGPVSIPALLAGDDGRGYDVLGLSVYSSYDWLKCQAIAAMARELYPEIVIVAGGYHASARPSEIVRDGSPFDLCVVGEGERPLVRIIESVAGGAPLRGQILGPEAIDDLDSLPPSDFGFLSRYRGVARRVASQAQVYLSRGCPFDCAFCMERAKREVSWRALSVERAVEEVERLHRFLDLSSWTLYVADALFGMKKSWRRRFLEELARRRLPVRKIWLLIRVDLVEDEDLALFADANCGLGFGLESGDPGLLATIRKAGRLDEYLDRMRSVAAWARERNVPWGANVICGHPGETPATLERSARYLRDLFLRDGGTTGFLSVDPFRLYPGSPIDQERAAWEQRFGVRFHRPVWWEDGDQELLSEWVDPSAELDWATREAMQHELLGPVLREIESRFVYDGPARDYFLRAVRSQAALSDPSNRLHYLDRYYAWSRYLGRGARADRERRASASLAAVSAAVREAVLPRVARAAGLAPDHPVIAAIGRVRRELFVPLDHVRDAARDVAVPLDATGEATVSAMHAYARSFSLLGVAPGQTVADLGAGTGYGSALLADLVGPAGRVVAVEIDPALAAEAQKNLSGIGNGGGALAPVAVRTGDALDPATWGISPASVDGVVLGFAVDALPAALAAALRDGTPVVAPVRQGDRQRLARAVVRGGAFEVELHEEVRYVVVRSAPAPVPEPERSPRRLPVVAGVDVGYPRSP